MATKFPDDDLYTVKVSIEKRTGEAHRLYRHNGKPCRRLVVDAPAANQLAGYTLIEKYLRNILGWLSEIDARHVDGTALEANGVFHYHMIVKDLTPACLTPACLRV